MGQCRTLDADVTIGCYYGDYNSCNNTIPSSFLCWNKILAHISIMAIMVACCVVLKWQ